MNRQQCVNECERLELVSSHMYLMCSFSCTRACPGCLAGSPLVKPEDNYFITADEAVAMAKWHEWVNYGGKLTKVHLSGGDCLLNPHIWDICRALRAYCGKQCVINLRCNGIGDPATRVNWQVCEEEDIGVDVRSYNIQQVIDWKKAAKASGYKVKCGPLEYGLDGPNSKYSTYNCGLEFNHIQVVEEPVLDRLTRFMYCSEYNRCIGTVWHPQIGHRFYHCSLPGSWYWIDKEYHTTFDKELIEGVDYHDMDKQLVGGDWSQATREAIVRPRIPSVCARCCRGESFSRYDPEYARVKKIKPKRDHYILKKDVPLGGFVQSPLKQEHTMPFTGDDAWYGLLEHED